MVRSSPAAVWPTPRIPHGRQCVVEVCDGWDRSDGEKFRTPQEYAPVFVVPSARRIGPEANVTINFIGSAQSSSESTETCVYHVLSSCGSKMLCSLEPCAVCLSICCAAFDVYKLWIEGSATPIKLAYDGGGIMK